MTDTRLTPAQRDALHAHGYPNYVIALIPPEKVEEFLHFPPERVRGICNRVREFLNGGGGENLEPDRDAPSSPSEQPEPTSEPQPQPEAPAAEPNHDAPKAVETEPPPEAPEPQLDNSEGFNLRKYIPTQAAQEAQSKPDGEPAIQSQCLAAALEYAERGWDVFPADISFDKATGKFNKKSYKSAEYSGGAKWGKTRDPKQIRRDFRRWPQASVAIPTGPDNGIVVFETDTPKGHNVDGEASLRALEKNTDRCQ